MPGGRGSPVHGGTARGAACRSSACGLQVLGQLLGVGQGANPTCQSARAITMWAQSDPDYLLHLVTQAARIDTAMMHFEGHAIN